LCQLEHQCFCAIYVFVCMKDTRALTFFFPGGTAWLPMSGLHVQGQECGAKGQGGRDMGHAGIF
jgi:hypothetical protein